MRPGTYLLSTAYTPTVLWESLQEDAEQEGANFVIVQERMRQRYINSLGIRSRGNIASVC